MATIIRSTGGSGKVTYALSINIPTGVDSITVERTVSGIGEDELLGIITEEDNIYKGDVLVTTGTFTSGYYAPTGKTYTVTGNTIATVDAGGEVSLPSTAFASTSWANIKVAANAIRDGWVHVETDDTGYKYINMRGNIWSVGDIKTLTISSSTYNVRIVDFQHWTDENSGWTIGNTDAINMELVEIYSLCQWYTSTTSTIGYLSSTIRSYVSSDFFDLLPTDFSGNLMEFTVKTKKYRGTATLEETSDKVTIRSLREAGVSDSSYATDTCDDCYPLNYYAVNDTSAARIKYYNGTAYRHWTRTCSSTNYSSNSNYYRCSILEGGSGYGLSTTSQLDCSYGVAPLFSY